MPLEIQAPQVNAHIGGNQVTGFSSSSTRAGLRGFCGFECNEIVTDMIVN